MICCAGVTMYFAVVFSGSQQWPPSNFPVLPFWKRMVLEYVSAHCYGSCPQSRGYYKLQLSVEAYTESNTIIPFFALKYQPLLKKNMTLLPKLWRSSEDILRVAWEIWKDVQKGNCLYSCRDESYTFNFPCNCSFQWNTPVLLSQSHCNHYPCSSWCSMLPAVCLVTDIWIFKHMIFQLKPMKALTWITAVAPCDFSCLTVIFFLIAPVTTLHIMGL